MPAWLMTALVGAAWFYPAYWVAMFLVRAAPALLKAAVVPGEQVLWFQVTPWYVAAVSRPGLLLAGAPPSAAAPSPAAALLLVALLLLLLNRTPLRRSLLAGLLVACVGQIGIGLPLARWFFSSPTPPEAPATVAIYAVALGGGLWRMLQAFSGTGIRLGAAGVAFIVPLTGFLLLAGRAMDVRFAVYGLGPALLLAGVVAALPGGGGPQPVSWRWAVAGVAAAVLLGGTARAGSGWMAQRRAEERNRMLAAAPPVDLQRPYDRLFFQKGVNLTAEGPAGYAPGAAREMLDHLARNGVNAVALVPYGFSRAAEPAVRFGGAWERDEDIAALAALARQRGIRILLKPQIWVRPGWPGDVHFDSAADRARWFAEYERFLVHYARLASRVHADLFCVGVEFGRMTRYEAEWRRLIRSARSLYAGPLVYAAAQGEEFETIRFWDALDYIGLNNYYPLPDDLRMDEVVRKVEAVHARYQRPVIFTEAGFANLRAPHRAPWDETPREVSPLEQARCYEALLRAFYHQPWFAGVYWWKVGANGYGGPRDPTHTPWGKPAMEVVARWYTQGGR
jgi:hypothetical protein